MNRVPKVIHYIWFGPAPKPALVLRCIASWQKYMPAYEIREWNEYNYDCQKIVWTREAWKAGKWAFVSDYARFDILYTYGGIYFDTDVELLRPLPESVLEYPAFTGVESAGLVNPGLIFGAVAEFPLAGEILARYQTMRFDPAHPVTVNQVVTAVLLDRGYVSSEQLQVVDGIAIYPPAVFCGYDQDVHDYDIRPETVSVHHYAGSWKKKTFREYLQRLLYRLLGKSLYKKGLYLLRRIRNRER